MNICIIGHAGHVYQTYTQMSRVPDARFVGIAPGSENENTEALQQYRIPVFSSYRTMLEKAKPDVAVVSPVFGYTGRIIKDCAERGIDVFAEKPIAGTLQELDTVESAVRESGIHFSAMHFLRFTPSFYHAQKLVQQGAIGDVRLLNAQKSYCFGIRPAWYADRTLYTGTIPWVGIHAIDWICFFARKPFVSVTALHTGCPEKAALCQFELKDQIFASASIDYYRPEAAPSHGDDRIRVAGTKGIIEVFEDRFTLLNDDGLQQFEPVTAPELAGDFLRNCEELTPDEVFTVSRVALAARESADRRTTILL